MTTYRTGMKTIDRKVDASMPPATVVPTEFRVGASFQNLFLKLEKQRVPASYSVGMAYLPAVLRKQGLLRYANFAVDIQDFASSRPFRRRRRAISAG